MNGLPLTIDPSALEPLLDELAERVARKIEAPPEPYINAEGAAEYLACDKRRIYDLVERGNLEPHRDGKRLLFRRSELDNYVSGLTCD